MVIIFLSMWDKFLYFNIVINFFKLNNLKGYIEICIRKYYKYFILYIYLLVN